MRWSDRIKGTMPIESAAYLAFAIGVLLILGVVYVTVGQAQTFYSTEEGTGLAVEIMPGVTYFAGPESGFAIETAPGVTTFDLHGPDLESHRGTSYNLNPSVSRPLEFFAPPVVLDPPASRQRFLEERPDWGIGR